MDLNLIFIFGVLLLIAWGAYWGCMWGLHKNPKITVANREFIQGVFAYGSLFVALSLLGVLGITLPWRLCAFWALVGLLLIYGISKSSNKVLWGIAFPLIGFVGTFAMEAAMGDTYISVGSRLGYTAFWAAFMGIFVGLDKIPFSSVIQCLIWGATALFGLIVLPHIPVVFTLTGSILFCIAWAISKVMTHLRTACFGRCVAAFMAFMWGGLFTFAMMRGAFWTTVLMLNTYLFIITFGILLFWQFMRQFKISGNDLMNRVSVETQQASTRCLLTHSGLLCILGILVWGAFMPKMGIGLTIMMAVVFIDLYNRLRDGGAAAPGVRDILSSMTEGVKVGVRSGYDELKSMWNDYKKGTDTKNPKAQESVQKGSKRKTK